jgi:hypothetical protein
MDMKKVMEQVRKELRARADSCFSEVYFRLTENGVTSIEIHNALYELLRRNEVVTTSGRWRLAAPEERRFTRGSAIHMKPLVLMLSISVLTVTVLIASAFAGVPPNPVPIITFVSPVSVNPGGAAFTLTVNGANFLNDVSVVNWNGTPLVTTYVSSDQLTAAVPAAQIANSGTGWITVTNPVCGECCGGGRSCETVSNLASNVVYLPVVPLTSTYTAVPLNATVGSAPLNLTGADFNGDGNLDLAVSNVADNTISILLGNGDGTFQPQTTLSTLAQPFNIAVGDINGDGIPDLVVGNDAGSGGLNVFLGNGSGGFTAGTTLSGGGCLLEPTLADINRDGKLDIVVADQCPQSANTIFVYLGNGDGTFAAPAGITGSPAGWGIVVADFNGDGFLDLAIADYANNSVDVYLGNGDGTFGTVNYVSAGFNVTQLVAADFNGDGKVDLLATSPYSDSGVNILYGNGDGTFQVPTVVAGSGNGFPTGATGDLNGDQILDIIGATFSATDLWLGAGEGAYQPQLTIGASGFSYGVVLANFATGGGLDVATVGSSGNQVIIFVPTVLVSPSSENFGSVAVGASAQQVFTVTNDTSSTVTISGISFTGANPGNFSQINTCTTTPLAAGATCTVTVTFTPTATGSYSATLSVADNAPASPQTASLAGSGVAAPIVSLSPTTLALGNVNLGSTSASQSVVLTNTGNAALVIASIGITGTNSADFAETNNCPGTLNPASQCTLMVTFTPSLVGAESAALQFTDNAGDSPEMVALSGTGVNVPPNYSVVASPTSLTIAQGQAGTTTLTITPVGGMTGTVAFTCTGLPAKASCAFAPTQIVMTGNDAAATVTLTVNTTGSNGVLSMIRPPVFRWTSMRWLALFTFPAGFILLALPGRMKAAKRRRRYVYLALLLLVGGITAIGMTACGSSSFQATPTGQYSVNVVASVSGSNNQSAVVSVTITQ